VLAVRPVLIVVSLAVVAGIGAAALVGLRLDAERQAEAADRMNTVVTTLTLPMDAVPVPTAECDQPRAIRCLRTQTPVDELGAALLASIGRQAGARPALNCETTTGTRSCTVRVEDGRHHVTVTLTSARTTRSARRPGDGTLVAVASR
jgi:hypothetical protein